MFPQNCLALEYRKLALESQHREGSQVFRPTPNNVERRMSKEIFKMATQLQFEMHLLNEFNRFVS